MLSTSFSVSLSFFQSGALDADLLAEVDLDVGGSDTCTMSLSHFVSQLGHFQTLLDTFVLQLHHHIPLRL